MNANPTRYKECREYMHLIANKSQVSEDILKQRLNIIFAIASLPEIYSPLRTALFELVQVGIIDNQEALDKTTNWLAAEFRINNAINKDQLKNKLINWSNQSQRSKQQLLSTLDDIYSRQGKQTDISQLSKKMRLTFPNLPNKEIYNEILKRFTNVPAKENKLIWDKLGGLKPRLLPYETNSAELWAQHQRVTGGRLRFRFPPQPNGYLHIGHCKSIRINFESAKRTGGLCYLRFDDTNPDSESHEFIDNILKEVKWMGYQPDRITYASDYFEELIQMALKLVQQGKAYVCNTPRQEMQEQRKNKCANAQRNLPVEHSLKYFPDLQPHQTLRLKLDPTAANPTLRDPVIYRTKDKPHPRTNHRFRIYPTYDFTHCISDSLEHIDYSLCSLEFEIRRELYYQILDMLRLYKPIVWEYSRLNIQGSFLSKRKIAKLVADKVVEGWDDPRLLTIAGLRNRGYTPSMLNSFIDRVNVARAGNENVIQSNVLQLEMRKELNKTAQRTMAVLQPIQLTLTNLSEEVAIEVPLYPERVEQGSRIIHLTKTVFVESSQDLPVGREVNLKYFKRIRITKIHNFGGKVSLQAKILESADASKKTASIHWISEADNEVVPVIELMPLINNDESINPSSEKVYTHAAVPRDMSRTKTYQFERVGYFRFQDNRLICCCRLV